MQQTITLPYLRTTPIHVPRRDLVLSASDSLLLSVAVVENDRPSAQALILSTDEDGPAMQLVLWNETPYADVCCDYQRPGSAAGTVLQSIPGTPGSAAGSWDFYLPTGTLANFPRRIGWTILLLWNDGEKSEVLSQGIVSVLRPFLRGTPLSAIPPDPSPPIIPPGAGDDLWLLTDDMRPILASDTLLQLRTS